MAKIQRISQWHSHLICLHYPFNIANVCMDISFGIYFPPYQRNRINESMNFSPFVRSFSSSFISVEILSDISIQMDLHICEWRRQLCQSHSNFHVWSQLVTSEVTLWVTKWNCRYSIGYSITFECVWLAVAWLGMGNRMSFLTLYWISVVYPVHAMKAKKNWTWENWRKLWSCISSWE